MSALSRSSRGRTGRPLKKAAGGLLLAAVVLGVVELGVRLVFEEDLATAEQPLPEAGKSWAPTMRGNPYLLWEYAPGMRDEFGLPVYINSLGLRGPEPLMPKPAGVRRLLATGDSSVYGFGVEDGTPYIEVAADLLGEAVEGHNAAIPGYSTFQTINLLQLRALKVEPDVVVIGNLWSDNNFDSFVDRDLLDAYSSWEDGGTATVRELLRTSALYRLLDYRVRVMGGVRAEARKVGWTVGKGQQQGLRRVEANDYARNLDRLVDLAHGADAEVLFVLLPSQDDLHSRRSEPPAWALYRTIMRDTAERQGAPLLDVPELFRAAGLPPTDLFLDEMHPTGVGHRVIGEALAEALAGWARGEPLEHEGTGSPRPIYDDTFVFGADGPEKVAPDLSTTESELPVAGMVRLDDFRGGTLQVDAVTFDEKKRQQVVGSTRLTGPGAFSLVVREGTTAVSFVIYEDVDSDGPSRGDRRFDLIFETWTLGANGLIDIELVLE